MKREEGAHVVAEEGSRVGKRRPCLSGATREVVNSGRKLKLVQKIRHRVTLAIEEGGAGRKGLIAENRWESSKISRITKKGIEGWGTRSNEGS